MKGYKLSILFFLIVLNFGCRSTKSLTSIAAIDANMSAKQIIRENQKQEARFRTLQAKVRVDYSEGQISNGATVTLRIEKDKTIWISAPLGAARMLITPNKVLFYDKINNQYFDGDFSLLSNLLGTDLDFKKVQNVLLGESIFNLEDDAYVASSQDNSYVLQPKNQPALFELFFLINPGYFKLDSQQLYQAKEKRILQIDYIKYQQVRKQILPENIRIIAVEDNNEVNIELDFKSISLNDKLRFPFNMPSGYKEIVIE